jgi:hypothetical protein
MGQALENHGVHKETTAISQLRKGYTLELVKSGQGF